ESKAARPNPLNKSPLRNKVDGHLPVEHLALRLRIESDVTGDGPADKALVDQFSNAATWNRGVIRNDREIPFSLPYQFIDDTLGGPDTHEAANHKACSIRNHGDGIFDRNRFHGRNNRVCVHILKE